MSKKPWLKLYCSDYLLDQKVTHLPLEAQGLLVRIWCIMWLHGCIPDDAEQIGLLVGVQSNVVSKHLSNIKQLLDTDDCGNLYSKRMDEELEKSEKISMLRKGAVKQRKTRPVRSFDSNKTQSNVQSKLNQSESESDIKPQQHRAARGTRIPDNFCVTEEHKAFAMTHHYPDPSDFIEEFRDYWVAAPGQKGVKLDWDATFRNWIRNNAARRGKSNGNGQQTLIGGLEQVLSRRRANGFHD